MRGIFAVESFVYSANLPFAKISFRQPDVSGLRNCTLTSFKILHLLQNFVIRENHDAREYPNTTAMGVPLLSKGFLYSEPECGRGLRCQNGIGGW